MMSRHNSPEGAGQIDNNGAVTGTLRALRTLAAANRELVRANSEPGFLQAVCEIAVGMGGYAMARIGFAEYRQDKAVRPVAQYDDKAGNQAVTNIIWTDTEQAQALEGSAIRTGRTQIDHDVLSIPLMGTRGKAALEYGIQSSMGLQPEHELVALGALTICARERDGFGEEEVALLEELARDVAFGIVTLRTRAERERSAERIRQYESSIRQRAEKVIGVVCAALKAHDAHTYEHQERVAALAVAIANEMGLPENEIDGVKVAALVHDVGSVRIPVDILTKTDALSEIEFSLVQEHARAGRDMLQDISFLWGIADIVWQHHERLDGSGYPRGLRGDEILLGARIIGVADVVEAMATDRPYREVFSMDAALEEIVRGRGLAFDPAVVDACIRLCRENRFEFRHPS